MGVAFLDGQKKSGGIKLNDVIEEYKYVAAGKTIKTGDFVSYINGITGETELTSANIQLSAVKYAGYSISAVALDSNRVFIAHSYGESGSLYGIIITINGATITCGTDTLISSESGNGNVVSTVLLEENKVFIAHRKGSNSSLMAIVCTIDGTSITIGTDTTISSVDQTGGAISAVKIETNKVFIAHRYGGNHYLYGTVCTINGTAITVGAVTEIVNSSKAGYVVSACLLPGGNVFISHSYGSNYHLYGIVVSISGTTITKGTDTVINNSDPRTGFAISACLLPNGTIFIAHSQTTNYNLHGIVVSVNGTTITAGTDTQISSLTKAGYIIKTQVLSDGNVFVMHNYDLTNYYLYGEVVTISGTTMTVGADTELNNNTFTGYNISAVLLDNGTVFIAHSESSSYYLNAQVWGIDETNKIPTNNIVITEYETQVTPAEETPFDAIALSDGIGGTETAHNEQVLIARPNVEVV